MKPLNISIRKKTLADKSKLSLYLDFNREVWSAKLGKNTRYEFLGLTIFKRPKGDFEKEHNRFVLEQAELRKSQVFQEVILKTYGRVNSNEHLDSDFLEFFQERIKTRKAGATRSNWNNAYKKFDAFCAGECLFRHVKTQFIQEYKDFLADQDLAKNSRRTYFSVFLTAIREAFERDMFEQDLSKKVKNFPITTAKREFLTEEEIQVLRKTPFHQSPVLVRAAFFCILTSLRWDDIRHLEYGHLQRSQKMGRFIEFNIRKADRPDILFINSEAFKYCEYEENKTGRIFPMRYREKDKVIEWFAKAGIKKSKGGFHIFRHTFAIRALNNGESIETVSSMMGHKSIKTTQIYARILGKTKQQASKRQTIEA